MPHRIKHILIVRHDAVGDVIVAMPAIRALKRRYPDAKITFMASNYSPNALILDGQNLVDEVIITPIVRTFTQFWALVRDLRRRQIDIAIHYSNYASVAWAAYFAGIPKNIGDKAVLGLWPVFRKWGVFYPPLNDMSHQVRYHFLLLKKLGIECEATPLHLEVLSEPNDRIRQKLIESGRRNNRPLVVVHPGANGGNKLVKPEKFIEYINSLKGVVDCDICLSGSGEEECRLRDRIVPHLNTPVLDLVGKTSLLEVVALVKAADVFVGIDTGPAHMAAAVHTPILFLSTAKRVFPFKWGPWLSPHVVVRNNRRCSIRCHGRACPEWTCVDDLPVDRMVSGTQALLRGDGVRTYDDQQRLWFSECIHIVVVCNDATRTAAKEYVDYLLTWNIYAFLKDRSDDSLYEFCVQNDIKIIHDFSRTSPILMLPLIVKFIRNNFHLPLLVTGKIDVKSAYDVVAFYREKYEARGGL